MNPFTDETRDARLKVDVDGFCNTLRAPEALAKLFMECKPAGLSTGDFALLEMFNGIIDRHKVAYDYRGLQRLLDTFFGPVVHERHHPVPAGLVKVPNGARGAERRDGGS